MARITKRLVDSLRPKKTNEGPPEDEETASNSKKDVVAWDDELRGFGVRFKSTGAGAYIIQYRNAEGPEQTPDARLCRRVDRRGSP